MRSRQIAHKYDVHSPADDYRRSKVIAKIPCLCVVHSFAVEIDVICCGTASNKKTLEFVEYFSRQMKRLILKITTDFKLLCD